MASRLRFPPEKSRLRRHPEPADQEPYRGPFQHDRDRIIHSRAFRRLAAKTQVATLPDSNHCRTRLTHTIEVSQVARSIATALDLNVELVEALALAHDLGHPPFGHVGEAALDGEMNRHGLSFDHNFHGLRIVEHFERRYAAFRGLNLTFEVREGILKHSRDLDRNNPIHQEYLPQLQPTLEAQLIDGADAIAYLSADMEDAVEGKYLQAEAVCDHVPAFAKIQDEIRSTYPGTSDRRVFTEALRRLVGSLVRGFVEGVRAETQASGATDWEEVRQLHCRIAIPSEPAAATMNSIRSVLAETYYNAISAQRCVSGYSDKLRELFRFYVEHPEALPESSVRQLGSEPLAQLVCDYIAGMTDMYLLVRHEKLIGGSHREAFRETPA